MSHHADKEPIADPDRVVDRLEKVKSDTPDVRLLEVDMEPENYEESHIPGAVGVDWEADIGGELGRNVISKDQFEDLAERCGITPDTTVIIYGDKANWFAAHAYWVFTYYGHEDIRLMDGGRHYWEWNEYPMTDEVPSFTRREYTASESDDSIRAFADDVKEAIDSEKEIIDTRNPREYRGESPPADIPKTTEREGHIPGAENIPWGDAMDANGKFKPEAELRERYEVAAESDEETITYCRIGERSSVTWFVIEELLDEDAANYDGSWSEWGSMEDAPVEQGDGESEGEDRQKQLKNRGGD
jgi:thiosulfate/3-mercaptopyruvate sulfurtransferase